MDVVLVRGNGRVASRLPQSVLFDRLRGLSIPLSFAAHMERFGYGGTKMNYSGGRETGRWRGRCWGVGSAFRPWLEVPIPEIFCASHWSFLFQGTTDYDDSFKPASRAVDLPKSLQEPMSLNENNGILKQVSAVR